MNIFLHLFRVFISANSVKGVIVLKVLLLLVVFISIAYNKVQLMFKLRHATSKTPVRLP